MKILLIDDQPKMGEAFLKILTKFEHLVTYVTSGEDALGLSDADLQAFEIAIIDMHMEGLDGHQTGLELKKRVIHLVTIMLTAEASIDTAVKALRDSQFDDYLCKRDIAQDAFLGSPKLQETLLRAQRLLMTRKALDNAQRLSDVFRQRTVEVQKELIGTSWSFTKIREMIEKVAPLDVPVFITGEPGSGKEMVAREIYKKSARALAPFVHVNCAAIPLHLLERELFGTLYGGTHEVQKQGFFQLAEGGTLFLDEVGEIPVELQAKLAKVLEDRQFYSIGSTSPTPIDIRLISTTSSDPYHKIKEKQFRQDFFYQLSVFTIQVPPLRMHNTDIEALILYFIKRKPRKMEIQGIMPSALAMLQQMSWKGNVRELENLVERALVLASQENLNESHFMQDPEFASLVNRRGQFVQVFQEIDQKKLQENKAYKQLLKKGWTKSQLDSVGFRFHEEIEEMMKDLNDAEKTVDGGTNDLRKPL